jgi:hypothetical protein
MTFLTLPKKTPPLFQKRGSNVSHKSSSIVQSGESQSKKLSAISHQLQIK